MRLEQVRCITWVIRPQMGTWLHGPCAHTLRTPVPTPSWSAWRIPLAGSGSGILNITHNLKYLAVQLGSLVGVKICVGIKSYFQTIQKGGLCLWEFSLIGEWRAVSLMQTHQLVPGRWLSQPEPGFSLLGFMQLRGWGWPQNLRAPPGEHWPMSD